MCANLVAAGYSVTAGDARAELERAVLQCGAQWRATLAEIAAGADILITMLPGWRKRPDSGSGTAQPDACRKVPQIDPGHTFAASYEATVEADAVLTQPGHHSRLE